MVMYTKDNSVVINLVQPIIYVKLKLNFPQSFKNVPFTYLLHKNMDLAIVVYLSYGRGNAGKIPTLSKVAMFINTVPYLT